MRNSECRVRNPGTGERRELVEGVVGIHRVARVPAGAGEGSAVGSGVVGIDAYFRRTVLGQDLFPGEAIRAVVAEGDDAVLDGGFRSHAGGRRGYSGRSHGSHPGFLDPCHVADGIVVVGERVKRQTGAVLGAAGGEAIEGVEAAVKVAADQRHPDCEQPRDHVRTLGGACLVATSITAHGPTHGSYDNSIFHPP